jgi:RNA polymerase sigma factor (sigma-70 family)
LLIAPSFVDALVTERISRLPMTEPAFLEFYARTAGRLHGYLRKLTGDPALAEDLLQEAYLRFLTRARGLDNDEHQKNYLFRIATNLARDHFRREQRRPLAHEAGSPAFGTARARQAPRSPTMAATSGRCSRSSLRAIANCCFSRMSRA